MPTSENNIALIHKEEAYRVVGAAFEVYNELGSGYLEAVYQEAMEIELTKRSIPFVSQAPLNVRYKNHVLKKHYVADFVCFSCVIVEIKAQSVLMTADEAQLLNELKASGLRVGVLANFGAKDALEWKRLVF